MQLKHTPKGDTGTKPTQTIATKPSKTGVRNRRNSGHNSLRVQFDRIQPRHASVLIRNP